MADEEGGRRGTIMPRHSSPGSGGSRSPDADGRGDVERPAQPAGHRRQPLQVAAVIAAAVRAGRRIWLQILILAIPVSVIGAGLEIVIDPYVDPSDALLSVGTALGSTGVTLLGTVLLSGYVCRLVGAAEHGQGAMSFLRVARSLPWWRLVTADILVASVVVVGLVLFVVPGLAALTLLAVVGPIIEIEHRPVLSAARRSAQLPRCHLGSVLLLATIPLCAVAELEAIAPEPHRAGEIVAFLAVRGLAEGIVEACVAVILVDRKGG